MSLLKRNQNGKLDVVDKVQSQASYLALEAQKLAKIGAINHSINEFKSKRANIYAQIGEKYCELALSNKDGEENVNLEKGVLESVELTELLKMVCDINDSIELSENEIEALKKKYDELEAGIKQSQSPPAGAKCPNCGKPFRPGDNFFCGECGADLRNIVKEQTCSKCKIKYDIETRFCKMCGTKLDTDNA